MATIPHTFDELPRTGEYINKIQVVRWTGLANGDVGQALDLSAYPDRSVQVVGTFGAGGSVTIQGSNNGDDFASLADPQGNALAITTAKIEAILEAVRYIRPIVTGDVTTSLAVILFSRK